MLTGCASIDGHTDPEDPFEEFNRSMYSFNSKVDSYALKPLAKGYDAITPTPVQKGVSNFFSNLDDVVVIFNDILQLKPGQFLSDTGRFLVNSTVGLYGLIDWASDIGLEKHNEDFGQTLGYWGIPDGPYLVLPLFGPSSVRDTGGTLVDRSYVDPVYNEVHEGMPFPERDSTVSLSLVVIDAVDRRAKLLKAESIQREAALDPYIFIRDAYLQRRRSLTYDGNPPEQEFDEERAEEYNLGHIDLIDK